jgi:hypothetical protein
MLPSFDHKHTPKERQLEALKRLHPTYSRAELEECLENFVRYLDFIWKIYERMQSDGRLQKILTDPDFNPTVKPDRAEHTNSIAQ